MRKLIYLFLLIPLLIPLFSLLQTSKVIVTEVTNPTCNFKSGIITQVRGSLVRTPQDFYAAIKDIKKGEYVSMVVNGKPAGCVAPSDGNLGVKVSTKKSSFIKFSGRIGGYRIVCIKTKDISSLEERIKLSNFPLKILNKSKNSSCLEIPLYIDISDLKTLLANGKFEGLILQEIPVINNSFELKIGNKEVNFSVNNLTVFFNSTKVDSFYLDDVLIKFINVTNYSVVVEEKFLTNKDIVKVFSNLKEIRKVNGIYRFSIPLRISNESEKRLKNILRGVKTRLIGKRVIYEGRLVYRFNNETISSLLIPFEVGLEKIEILNVIGFEKDYKSAFRKLYQLEIALKTKPIFAEIQGVKEINGNYWLLLIILPAFVLPFFIKKEYYLLILFALDVSLIANYASLNLPMDILFLVVVSASPILLIFMEKCKKKYIFLAIPMLLYSFSKLSFIFSLSLFLSFLVKKYFS